MRRINLRAMAKINLSLDVIGTRPDGYHDLRMVMQSVRLSDQVTVSPTRAPGVRMKTNLRYLPADQTNLAARAAADAAAVLVAMNLLFGLRLPQEKLREMGKRLGADIPFCVMRGTALAEGIGEVLTPLPALPDCRILIAKPDIHVSTKAVFDALHMTADIRHPDTDAQVQAARNRDLAGVCSRCGNVLESVTEARYPVISRIKAAMQEQGALVSMMSGSGPSVFGIFEDEGKAEAARDTLARGTDASFVYLTRPYNRRTEIYD